MNPLWVAVLGAGAGTGVYLAASGLRPARVPLGVVLAQLHSPALLAEPDTRATLAERAGRLVGRVAPVDRLVPGRQRSRVVAALRLLDRSVEAHVGAKVGYAVVGAASHGPDRLPPGHDRFNCASLPPCRP